MSDMRERFIAIYVRMSMPRRERMGNHMRLIDADALKTALYYDVSKGTYGEFMDGSEVSFTDREILKLIDQQPTIEDAVPLDGSFLKMSKGGYVIYQRKWLYEHLEQEFNILKSASGKPTVDAEPMRHGKWIEKSTGGEHFWCCSECGYIEWDAPNNYCPNCGADMRGEKDG
jgi:hypothetical protein